MSDSQLSEFPVYCITLTNIMLKGERFILLLMFTMLETTCWPKVVAALCPAAAKCDCNDEENQKCENIFRHKLDRGHFNQKLLNKICGHSECSNKACGLERDCLPLYVGCFYDTGSVKNCSSIGEDGVFSVTTYQCEASSKCIDKTHDKDLLEQVKKCNDLLLYLH
uniref:Uncharacterized protein n=1 Tax=Romanomermis culicivorax TaxID=13658 RepID=A0A915HYS0_ROMCU